MTTRFPKNMALPGFLEISEPAQLTHDTLVKFSNVTFMVLFSALWLGFPYSAYILPFLFMFDITLVV